MPHSKKIFLLFILSIAFNTLRAQETGRVSGIVKDESGFAVPGVSVYPIELKGSGVSTDERGSYSLPINAGELTEIVYSSLGYESDTFSVYVAPEQDYQLNVELKSSTYELDLIEIEDKQKRETASVVKLNVEDVENIPTPMGGIEGAIVTQGLGVSSTSELSSNYSVRGGNYDENLVYVNDFEVYRPFLIRSGQQEGLSFINPELVSSVEFSSGGFQPRYGDKMASVLDVTYKKPKKFGGSASGSFLGGTLHLEAADKNQRFTFLGGIRYKSNQYLLNSLETTGDYSPTFLDIQSFMTYKINDKLELEWINNYARNRFEFVPNDRESTFGVVNQVLRLTMYFEGQENDQYDSYMSGLALVQKIKPNFQLKWMASYYRTREQEAFDILGEYFIGEVETDFSDDDFGQVRYSLGAGALHHYARNDLTANIYNGGFKGNWQKGKHYIQFGARYQREMIQDRVNEWEKTDSAGFTIPYYEDRIELSRVLKSEVDLNSHRINGYFQDSWNVNESKRMTFTYGARFTYWDVNHEFVVSPRAQFSYKPGTRRDVVFKFASGLYAQPPFYRELRNLDAVVNKNVKSQKSVHVVAGTDLNFTVWDRPFTFVTEVYYKYLYDLVPYEFDNVLIRYFGENKATGYVAGVDFRLNGQFVKGEESYISMSIMQAQENIEDETYIDSEGNEVDPGFIPRPTDQRFRFSMFFQDYFPKSNTFKVHLNFIYATGLPFGPPDNVRYNDDLRIPAYRRVDIGFSAGIYDRSKGNKLSKTKLFGKLKSIWATLEVYNLFGVENTISYLWIKDITNRVYAVPNTLTARRINLRLIVKF
ncbi:MAG: TonB-dependent receptor [Chitinophagales bacterium]